MPIQKNISATPIRRSPRAPARVKVKFDEVLSTVGEKRKRSISAAPAQISTRQAVNNVNNTDEQPARKKSKSDKKIDSFCWLCHKKADDGQGCSSCPRMYHYQCLGPANRFTEQGICPECRLTSTDGTVLNSALSIPKLSKLLPLALNRILNAIPSLKMWPRKDSENENLIRIMDLSILEDRLNADVRYMSTADFFADVKWILHNCHIAYGTSHSMTSNAKKLVKLCKMELNDIEACPECYEVANTSKEDFFSKVCNEPHTLVWAKLKGFPHWPAKVLKVIDGIADVRFFGSHEKAKVPITQCFLLSEESPNDKNPKQMNFQAALEEVKLYIQNVVEKHGRFQYASLRTPYNPGDANHVTKVCPKKTTTPKSHGTKSRRPRKSDNPVKTAEVSEVPVISSPKEVIDLIDIEENGITASPQQKEIEIVCEQDATSPNTAMMHKKNFMKHLELSKISPPWRTGLTNTGTIANTHNSLSSEAVTIMSSSDLNSTTRLITNSSSVDLNNVPGVCMDFCVEDRDSEENVSESMLFQSENETVQKDISCTSESHDVVTDIINKILKKVTPNSSDLESEISEEHLANSVNEYTNITSPSKNLSKKSSAQVDMNTTISSENQNYMQNKNVVTSVIPHDKPPQLFVASNSSSAEINQESASSPLLISYVRPTPSVSVIDHSSNTVVPQVELNTVGIEPELTTTVEIPTVTQPPVVIDATSSSIISDATAVSSQADIEIMDDEPVITSVVLSNRVDKSACICPPFDRQNVKHSFDTDVVSPSVPVPVGVEKYVKNAATFLQSTITEMWDDLINEPHIQKLIDSMQREIEELKESKKKQEQHLSEIKTNTDLIISKMKLNLETEKKKAVEDARNEWENKAHKEKEKSEKLIEQMKKDFEIEKEKAILETKNFQWCAYCKNKSMYYCCWNTSYCGKTCQAKHWADHHECCEHRVDPLCQPNEVTIPQTDKPKPNKRIRKTIETCINNIYQNSALPKLKAQPKPPLLHVLNSVSSSTSPAPYNLSPNYQYVFPSNPRLIPTPMSRQIIPSIRTTPRTMLTPPVMPGPCLNNNNNSV